MHIISQASSLKREKDKCASEGEEGAAEDILSLGILSWFDNVLSDGTILKKLRVFSFMVSLRKIFVYLYIVVLVYLSV